MFTNHIHHPLIIIGMHRSGTTMLADTLNKAGVFMGAFREQNGEALHFLSLNQQMLWAAGADWLTPVVPSPEHDKTLSPNLIYAEHIKSPTANYARLRWFINVRWGWKDPRNTFTLPLWLARFPQARVLHVVRDGRAVALSLQTRNTVAGEVFDTRLNDLDFCFKLWETYVAQAMSYRDVLPKNNYLQISYEDLIAVDPKVVLPLDHFTGVHIADYLNARSRSKQIFPEGLNALAQTSGVFKALGYTV
jgi:hypothetical protein